MPLFGRKLLPLTFSLIKRSRAGRGLIGCVLLAGALHIGVQGTSRAEGCPSGVTQPHNHGDESFNTSSRVYRSANVHVYETCVENNGGKDLWLNWFIPGPRSYVLQGQALPSLRAKLTREIVSLKSCIEYGSLADLTRADFLGHASDTSAVDREWAEGCRAAANTSQARADSFSEFSLPIEAYIPSDKDDPSGTMLRFTGSVAAEERDNETYATTIEYNLEPVLSATRAEPKDLRLRPLLAEASAYAAQIVGASFRQAFSEGVVPLEYAGALEFPLQRTQRMLIENVAFGFFDRDDRFVGAVYILHWLPEPE